MAAIAIAYVCKIDLEVIRDVLMTFKGVEHRQEFVRNLDNVIYVNDSKGTNPDSTIKAIQSYDRPIILIAGGMDKGSNFDELLETAKSYVKSLVLLGETASNIENCAKNKGFNDIHIVKIWKKQLRLLMKFQKWRYSASFTSLCKLGYV